MVPLDREFEERKMRVEAQLALIKDGVQARNQTIITIAISSLSLIGVSKKAVVFPWQWYVYSF